MDEESLLEFIQFNIIYATQHRNRVFDKEDIHFHKAELLEKALFGQANVYTDQHGKMYRKNEEYPNVKAAVQKRFLLEQAGRTKEVIDELCMLKDVQEIPVDCLSILKVASFIDGGHTPRIENAKWHISYYTDTDKSQIEDVMKRTGCNSYELYQGIDKCLKEFKM